jgi:hypothetical protein
MGGVKFIEILPKILWQGNCQPKTWLVPHTKPLMTPHVVIILETNSPNLKNI